MKLVSWLKEERTPVWLLGFALAVAIFELLLQIPISLLVSSEGASEAKQDEIVSSIFGDDFKSQYRLATYHANILGNAFFFALLEEVIFRTLPLGFAIGAQRKSWIALAAIVITSIVVGALAYDSADIIFRGRDPIILSILGGIVGVCIVASIFSRSYILIGGIVIASSALFAYIHAGWASLPMQGLGGIALSIVYLKSGGLNGSWAKATWYATVSHTAFNIVLFEFMLMSMVYDAGT